MEIDNFEIYYSIRKYSYLQDFIIKDYLLTYVDLLYKHMAVENRLRIGNGIWLSTKQYKM